MGQHKVVIVGAGVAGLTTALLLSKNQHYKITVAAKHMPGDYDIEYASPWAGANYMPVSIKGTPAAERDKKTWPVLEELAQNHPEAGIHFQSMFPLLHLSPEVTHTALRDRDIQPQKGHRLDDGLLVC